MTPERANNIGYLLDNFEQHAVAAHAEQTDSADQRLRDAANAITDLVERLRAERNQYMELLADVRAERDRALKVIRQAYEAGDDAWRICANALHPTNPTKLAETRQP